MAIQLKRKRYTPEHARLLADVVDFAQDSVKGTDAPHRIARYVHRAERVLTALLKVCIGDWAIAESVIESLQSTVRIPVSTEVDDTLHGSFTHEEQVEMRQVRLGAVVYGALARVLLTTTRTSITTSKHLGGAALHEGVSIRSNRYVLNRVQVSAIPVRNGFRFELDADPRAALALQLLRLVQEVGPNSIQRCDCERLFVRIGKRRSCSTRCAKRVYMRKYRVGDAGKE